MDHGVEHAAGAAARRIERLEHALLLSVAAANGCKDGGRCGRRYWDNKACECARKAREFLPASERD